MALQISTNLPCAAGLFGLSCCLCLLAPMHHHPGVSESSCFFLVSQSPVVYFFMRYSTFDLFSPCILHWLRLSCIREVAIKLSVEANDEKIRSCKVPAAQPHPAQIVLALCSLMVSSKLSALTISEHTPPPC